MSPQTTVLSNGVRVVYDHMPHLETVSVGLWVDVGARHETLAENGISHLLEHMAFKGTKRRTAKDIAEEIESVGGHLNAYTSRDNTSYYARVLKDDLPLGIDILSDIVRNSVFDENELLKEKEVIVQEIGQAEDTPDDVVFERFQETAFPNQPIGRSILGTVDRVRSFCVDDLNSFQAHHYGSQAIVVAVAGNFEERALIAMLEDALGGLKTSNLKSVEPARYVGGFHATEKNLEQSHITLGFPSLSFNDPNYYALQVYSTILGGGMSSRLFQEVRENRGLAYSIYSFVAPHSDTGIFGIYAGTGPDQSKLLFPVVADEMKKMTHLVTEKEVERAKTQLKAGLLMSLESTSSRIEQMGRQMLIYNRPLEVGEMIKRVEAIDKTSVENVAVQTLEGAKTVAMVGKNTPHGDIEALFKA
ncbi:MAG: insulinase family protein [Sphingomonadales bacterium]|nr:insulinase family protein [Sphingomonadales bacterium]